MSDTETPPITRDPRSSRRALVIRTAKWGVAVIVIVGLVLAAKAAVGQWQSESKRIASELTEIEQQLESASDPQERERLTSLRNDLRSQIPSLRNLRWDLIGAAGILYGLGMIPPAFVLRRSLLSLGQTTTRGTAIAAQLLGHAGKYVPGKAMVIVLRAGALSRDGVKGLPATVSIFLETFLMMAVGATIAGVIVVWLPVPRWIAVSSLVVAVAASLPTTPPVLQFVANRISHGNASTHAERIGWRLFAAGWGWSTLSWVLISASFTCLVASIPGAPQLPSVIQLLPITTAAITLAMVAGFASLIPGGAGVRELVLTTVLGVAVGPVRGILAAIATRILYIVVEAIMAGASWIWLRRSRNDSESEQTGMKENAPS